MEDVDLTNQKSYAAAQDALESTDPLHFPAAFPEVLPGYGFDEVEETVLDRSVSRSSSQGSERRWRRTRAATVSDSHVDGVVDGVPSVSSQETIMIDGQGYVSTSQMSPGSRGLPPTPGKGRDVMTSSATSFTSDAERNPSGSGIVNTSRSRHFRVVKQRFNSADYAGWDVRRCVRRTPNGLRKSARRETIGRKARGL